MRNEQAHLDDLVSRWYELRQQGNPIQIEELCAGCPDLAADVRQHIEAIASMEQFLRVAAPGPTDFESPLALPRRSEETTQLLPQPTTPAGSRHASEVFPRRFGRYTLLSVLGEGGMGKVYKAHDPHLDLTVALKVPKAAILQDPQTLDRFYQEARALAKLTHPHVCRVFDVNEHHGQHYLVMAHIDGRPLALTDAPSPRAAADLVRTLALTLAEVHAQGVLHRDLKPGNILIDRKGKPILVDFGLALDLTAPGQRPQPGEVLGTIAYMAPERARGLNDQLGPACDVYSLGVILYELLAGRRPFTAATSMQLVCQIGDVNLRAPPPTTYGQDLDPALTAICLKALAKPIAERYANMEEFAEALRDHLASSALAMRAAESSATGKQPRPGLPSSNESCSGGPDSTIVRPPAPLHPSLPLPRDVIRFEFVGFGAVAPRALEEQDRLYLDVGNALRPGVLDHHQESGVVASTASLVMAHPEHLAAAVKRWRQPGDPFTLTLHQYPDLDSVASTFLATAWLTTQQFPVGAEELTHYTDAVDAGRMGLDPERPFTLYAAYAQLKHRLALSSWLELEDLWLECVTSGLKVVEFVLKEAAARGVQIQEVDAFQTPGLFRQQDRREVQSDAERYRQKLADPRCQARRATVRLPGAQGKSLSVPALLVRDVQNDEDPERCMFFKDWARADRQRCPATGGFVALVVFGSEVPNAIRRRCILSVRPNAGVTLQGLGALLDQAECARRRALHGEDDRVVDPATGTRREPRPGYANADPWYDGRAHGYTIVDAPRSGTVLTAEEIERIFLQFGGGATALPLELAAQA